VRKINIKIELHYLGSLEYFVQLLQADHIVFEINDHFIKQTHRNRCNVLSSNGIQTLSVPVHYKRQMPYKDVIVDYNQDWVKDHCRTIQSAYAKAPYFDYFFDMFRAVWLSKPDRLIDLSVEMMTICLKLLQVDKSFEFSSGYSIPVKNDVSDYRDKILTKQPYEQRNIYKPFGYLQNFGNNFVHNLSLIDLLMCGGTGALEILKKSSFQRNEQI
jgi:hypothetical protein